VSDAKGIIRSSKSKNDRQYNGQKKKDQKDRHYIKHYTENKESSNTNPTKTGVNSGGPEGLAGPAPYVTPVLLLLDDTSII
jgi:hypothetical protein